MFAFMVFSSGFLPAIAEIKMDRTIVRPGDLIWVTYTFANLGDKPAQRN